jgi:hypothetical protein
MRVVAAVFWPDAPHPTQCDGLSRPFNTSDSIHGVGYIFSVLDFRHCGQSDFWCPASDMHVAVLTRWVGLLMSRIDKVHHVNREPVLVLFDEAAAEFKNFLC